MKKSTSQIFILLLSLLLTFFSQNAKAQDISIAGNVVDGNGVPVAGANVTVTGTDLGITTDSEGKFSLTVPAVKKSIVISFIGFVTKEVQIAELQTNHTVILQEEAIALNDVVVIGYEESNRRSVTSSIAKLGGESLQNIPISSVGEGLKGKIAGLRVTQSNFTPGGGFTYRIRGGSSVNGSNSPLVLVDGVERDFSAINPNDILSIDVLKDAASSAIYGAKASNGIILVTTKRGGYNRAPKITFEAKVGVQNSETKIDFLNAEDYITVVRNAVAEYLDVPSRASAANSYLNGANSAGIGNSANGIYSPRYYNSSTDVLPKGYKTMQDPLDPSKTIMFADNDWQDLLYSPSLWQNYYVGIDGGSDIVRYSASLGYTDDEGVALATGYDRVNFKTNMDAKVAKKLTVSMGVDFARTNTEAYADQRNTISRGLSSAPTMRVYYDDGTPVQGYNATSLTPIFYEYYYDRSRVMDYLSLNAGLKWDIIDGLSANVQGSFFKNTSKNKQFIKANEWDTTRKSSWSQATTERKKLEAFLSYKKTFDSAHHVSLLGGYSYQNRFYETVAVAGYGGTSDKVTTINGSSTFDPNDITSSEQKEAQIGFFGRVNYDYKNKYLLTGTFRADASSKFVKDNRWGYFPGISLGWVMTEEPWLNNVKDLSFLKLRASYGSTGNNASVGIYDAFGSYSVSSVYNGNSAIQPSEMPNEKLQWETSNQLDLGVEAGLFNNRIYLSADYYNKVTSNLLYQQKLPNTTGYSSLWTNIGKARFWGYELELTSRNIEKRDFRWESKLVLSYQWNKVLELPDNGIDKNRTGGIALDDGTYYGGIAEGEPLYRFYGYKATGIIEDEQQAANAYYDALARLPKKGAKRVGDYEWADRNGDKQITTADRYCLGVTVPPFTGGLNNDFAYKNFKFTVYLDWAMGHSIFDDSFQRYFYGTYTNNYALASDVLKAWKKKGDDTKYARFYANDSAWGNDNYNRVSNVFTYKGDYLCLREVSVQYSLPKKIFNRSKIDDVTLSVSGNNLYYFTAVKGISPEQGTSSTYDGDSYSNYPPIRRITFGVRMTF